VSEPEKRSERRELGQFSVLELRPQPVFAAMIIERIASYSHGWTTAVTGWPRRSASVGARKDGCGGLRARYRGAANQAERCEELHALSTAGAAGGAFAGRGWRRPFSIAPIQVKRTNQWYVASRIAIEPPT